MEPHEIEAFFEESQAYLDACQENARSQFGIGSHARFGCDLEKGDIWWSNGQSPEVRAKVTIVGSWASNSNSWLWAWENASFSKMDHSRINKVREFGKKEDIAELSHARWEADQSVAWDVTAASAKILQAEGAYCCPVKTGALFLLLHSLERVS